jgi:hypothetical protein
MSNTRDNNEEFQDRELERAVYRAMAACGWVLPRTPEELRQAEAELASDPIELPESLRHPFRILDAPEAIPRTETPAGLSVAGQGPVRPFPLDAGLQRLATELSLDSAQVVELISMQAQVIANRSTTRNQELSYEDWKRFYDSVKEFL